MRQIFCVFIAIFLLIAASCAGKQEKVQEIGSKNVYRITLSDSSGKVSSKFWTRAKEKNFKKWKARKTLKNVSLNAKIGVDTAANEPRKACENLAKNKNMKKQKTDV